MCVIIDRKANTEIPFDKLEVACDINKHGFGLVYAEKGQLHIIRDLNNNDPKVIQKLLNEHKKRRVWLHLRHATVGAVILENSHPMVSLTKKEDGIDMVFMHNGTLSEFSTREANDLKSDTYYYNERLIKPLAKRCVKFGGLQDKFFQWQISKSLAYSQSVLLFIDGTGYTLRGNSDKGKEFDWGWASNDYSFDTQHIRSSTRTPYGFGTIYGDNDYYYDPPSRSLTSEKWNDRKAKRKQKIRDSHFSEAWAMVGKEEFDRNGLHDPATQSACLKMDMKALSEKLKEVWKVTETSLEHDIKSAASLVPTVRKTFVEQAGLKDIDEVNRLSREDFITLCDNHPNAMAELFIDLVAENRRLKNLKVVAELAEKRAG